MTWRTRAACRGLPIEIFYPTGKDGSTRGVQEEDYDAARTVCGTCPVSDECLTAALREEADRPGRLHAEVQGFRGGRTASQRVRMINDQELRQADHRRGGARQDPIWYYDPPVLVETHIAWAPSKDPRSGAYRDRNSEDQGSAA